MTLPFVEERLAEARGADGPRFLVLRRRAEPQGVWTISSPSIMPKVSRRVGSRSTNCFIPPPTRPSFLPSPSPPPCGGEKVRKRGHQSCLSPCWLICSVGASSITLRKSRAGAPSPAALRADDLYPARGGEVERRILLLALRFLFAPRGLPKALHERASPKGRRSAERRD